jgi:hypothetical protein
LSATQQQFSAFQERSAMELEIVQQENSTLKEALRESQQLLKEVLISVDNGASPFLSLLAHYDRLQL